MNAGEGRKAGRRPVFGLVAVVLVALAAWWVVSVRADRTLPEAGASPVPSAATPTYPVAAADVLVVKAAAPASVPPEQPVPPGHVEVCGRPPIPQIVDDPVRQAAQDAEIQQVVEPEYLRWLEAMQRHAEPRVRAAGLVMDALHAMGERFQALSAALKPCGDDMACQLRVVNERQEPDTSRERGFLDKLAKLATATNDPALYGLAAQVCAAHPKARGTACGQVSLAQWARLEPDNLGTWMRLADEAQARKDPSARAEALHRAIGAGRQVHHEGLVLQAFEATRSADLHPMTRLQAQIASVSLYSLWLAPHGAALQHCTPEQLHDHNRRQTCEALAEAMIERGDSLLQLQLGRAIGERLGWPIQRIEDLRASQELMYLVGARAAPPETPMDCASVASRQRYFSDWARHGELGALRSLAAEATPEERAKAREAARRRQDQGKDTTPPR